MKLFCSGFLFILLFSNLLLAQSITGKLIDQNGNDLAGYEIKLYIAPEVYSTVSGVNGNFIFSNITDVKKQDDQLPTGYAISENFPNPFNPKTRIMFIIPNSGNVRVKVFNLLGQKVLDEINRQFSAGTNFIDLDLNGLSNGIYVANIIIDNKYVVNKKLMLLYGTNHLSSSSGGSFPNLSKTTSGTISKSAIKLDSMVIIASDKVKRIIKNLPNMVSDNLDLGEIIFISSVSRPCDGIPTIIYEGRTYYTVQIGTQCWLNENLDTGVMILSNQNQSNNGMIEKYCYDNDENNCIMYGGLYKWDEAMLYKASSNTSKGICPDGWHIPSVAEYDTLFSNTKSRSKNLIAPLAPIAGRNNSGFSALLGGYWTNNTYSNHYQSTELWTVSDNNSVIANAIFIDSSHTEVGLIEVNKSDGLSIRCIKDNYLIPNTPKLESPSNDLTKTSISPILKWHSVSGATHYTLQVSKDSLFSYLIYNQNEISDTCKQVVSLEDSTQYYWKVSAQNNYGTSAFSSYWSFTTENSLIRITENTKEIENDPNFQSVAIDSTSLIIEYKKGSVLPTLAPDDILIGNSGGGYLRKVVSIQEQNNKLVVTTTDASLDEAFSKLQIDTSCTFETPLQKLSAISYNKTIGKYTYNITSNDPIITVDKLTNTTAFNFPDLNYSISSPNGTGKFAISVDNLKLDLKVTIDKFQFNVAKKNFSLIYKVSCINEIKNMKMKISGILEAQVPDENHENLFPTDLYLGCIPIGPILNGLVFSFNIAAGASVNLADEGNDDFASTIRSTTAYRIGAEYINGSWSVIHDKTNTSNCDVNIKPYFNISGEGRLFFKPKINARLLNITGPSIILPVYGYTGFSYSPLIGEVGVGLDAGLEYNVELFSRKIAKLSTAFTWGKLTLWKDTLNHIPNEPSNPIPINGAIDQGSNVTLNWSCSDRDGEQLQYDVYCDKSNPPTTRISTMQSKNSYNLSTLQNNSTYYWKIIAFDSFNESASSKIWSFSTSGVKLQSPSLVSPIDNSNDVSLTPTLVWMKNKQATSYSLQVSIDNSFSSLVLNMSSLKDTSYQMSGLGNSTKYYWRVSASNNDGTSGWSTTWSFTTENKPSLGTPLLISPSNNSTNISVTPGLAWHKCKNAKSYTLQVSTDSLFSSLVFNQSEIIDTTTQLTGLNYSTTYYWRIVAFSDAEQSALSLVWRFSTITNSKPNPPILVLPINGAMDIPRSPIFTWEKSDHANSYSIQIAPDSSFPNNPLTIYEIGLTDTVFCMQGKFLYSTKYYWRMNARNEKGYSDWSKISYFTTVAHIIDHQPCAGGMGVQIGTQCWMNSNLDIGTMIPGSQDQLNNGIVEKYCYDDDPNNCAIYGGLYQWAEAVQYTNGATNMTSPNPAFSGNIQGVCPSGWHLPYFDEIALFEGSGGRIDGDGNALKAVGQGTGLGTGTNASGFSALIAGTKQGGFSGLGYLTFFWSSSDGEYSGVYFELLANSSDVHLGYLNNKYLGASVRCIKD